MSIINGRLPAATLTAAYRNPSKQLRKGKPATSFMRMSQRSHCQGYGYITITDGYRSADTSERLFRAHYVPKRLLNGRKWFDSWWWKGETWCRVSGTARIAPPGDSNHGLGIAADLAEPYASNGPKHSWLMGVCAFYGWYLEGAAFGEPWHWTFKGFPARPVLQNGSRGTAVTAWQVILRYEGFKLAVDGKFGSETERLTKVLQRRWKLAPDGRPGPKTWAKAGLA